MEGLWLIVFVFVLSFGVHVWSATVGGGGPVLITALVFLGLSPQAAIATNRFGSLCNIFALLQFHRDGHVKWRLGLFLAIFAGLGSVLGSVLLLRVEGEVVERGIGVITLLSLPMILLKPKAGMKEGRQKFTKAKQAGGASVMFLLGILGGFFSATGIWFSYVYIFYYGMTFLQTAATRKISGLCMLVFSLAVLIPANIIHWPIALSMFFGGALGSWVSALYANKLGNEWVKYIFLFVMMCMGLAILLF